MADSSGDNLREVDKETCRLEYAILRGELLKRIEMRQQVLALTITLAAAFLGFGLDNSELALVYPPLAALLFVAWSQNDFQTRGLADYIRTRLEDNTTGSLPDLHWETLQFERRSSSRYWRFVAVSHGGIFLATQLIALVIGGITFPVSTNSQAFLIAIDVLSILFVIRFIWRSR